MDESKHANKNIVYFIALFMYIYIYIYIYTLYILNGNKNMWIKGRHNPAVFISLEIIIMVCIETNEPCQLIALCGKGAVYIL